MTIDGISICIVSLAVILNGITTILIQKRIDALEAKAAKDKAA